MRTNNVKHQLGACATRLGAQTTITAQPTRLERNFDLKPNYRAAPSQLDRLFRHYADPNNKWRLRGACGIKAFGAMRSKGPVSLTPQAHGDMRDNRNTAAQSGWSTDDTHLAETMVNSTERTRRNWATRL